MAAGQGFKTFATGDVLTAADTNGYLMQGVWVFASAAARNAAVTSPQEGNMCYLKDTDAVQFYNGTAWTAVAAASTTGLTFIDRQTFSTVSSFSFTSKFSSTYDNYKIVLRIDSTVTAANIQMRLRSASTDNTSSNYRSGRLFQNGTTVTGAGGTATATSFDLITDYNAQNSYLSMDLYAPYLTQYTGYTAQASYFYTAFGQHNQMDAGQMSVTTSYDGITFLPNTGTMTGEVYLYGYSRA